MRNNIRITNLRVLHYRFPYPIYLFCDHRPILFLWSRRGQLSHRFFKYQVVLTKFQNLKIIYTEGKNLAFPDLLSRQVPHEKARKFQIEHETVPKDNRFYTSDYKPINYSIIHCDEKKAPPNISYPEIAHITGQKKKILKITDEDFSINDASDDIEQTCSAIYNIADSFRYGRQTNQKDVFGKCIYRKP